MHLLMTLGTVILLAGWFSGPGQPIKAPNDSGALALLGILMIIVGALGLWRSC
jgi:hypothetical protein